MTIPLPLEIESFGPHHGGPPFAAFLGVPMFLLFLLLVAGSILLIRRGGFGPHPPFVRSHSPEAEAKRVLAERFAKGDITSDDFLERASVLNWTPGSESWQTGKKRR